MIQKFCNPDCLLLRVNRRLLNGRRQRARLLALSHLLRPRLGRLVSRHHHDLRALLPPCATLCSTHSLRSLLSPPTTTTTSWMLTFDHHQLSVRTNPMATGAMIPMEQKTMKFGGWIPGRPYGRLSVQWRPHLGSLRPDLRSSPARVYVRRWSDQAIKDHRKRLRRRQALSKPESPMMAVSKTSSASVRGLRRKWASLPSRGRRSSHTPRSRMGWYSSRDRTHQRNTKTRTRTRIRNGHGK